MNFISIVVDFFLVVLTIEVSDGQSVRPLAVAVASGAITQVGRENFVGTVAITKVMGCGVSVKVGAQVILFPKIITFATVTQTPDCITGICMSSMKLVSPSFFKIVITEVSDGKSMGFVEVAADFCPVAVVTNMSDRQSVASLAIAVDSFHDVTVGMGD